MHRFSSLSSRRLILILLACLALGSCFEPPVREDLHLRFLPNGAVVVTTRVRIASPEVSNQALAHRLAAIRRELLEGTDAWGPRFAAVEPAAERFSWEKRLGELQSVSRSAVVAEPAGLAPFFSDTALRVLYQVYEEDGIAELSIAPGLSSRATRKQRREMEELFGPWSEGIASYLEAGQALYAYVEDHPDRARVCFGTLFGDLLPEEEKRRLGEPTEDEASLLKALEDAMGLVWEVLVVREGAEYSPDEISHLVYDPFPARLTVSLPSQPLSVEGFEKETDGALAVPGLGLWEAFRSLEGQWLSPDPALLYVNLQGKQDEPLDLNAFLGQPRRTVAPHLIPSAEEVQRIVEDRLTPAPLYRVSWKVQPGDETEFRWSEGEGTP